MVVSVSYLDIWNSIFHCEGWFDTEGGIDGEVESGKDS